MMLKRIEKDLWTKNLKSFEIKLVNAFDLVRLQWTKNLKSFEITFKPEVWAELTNELKTWKVLKFA